MSALPSNLALVGEDLARATSTDVRRSLARRRALTVTIAVAVLVVTASAAVANGWLFGETPTLRAAPALGSGQGRGAFAPGDAVSAIDDLTRAEAAHRAATPGSGGQAPLGSRIGRSRILLENLGAQGRTLRSVTTSTGGVCLILSGFSPQCVPTFKNDQALAWYLAPSAGATIIFGIARDDVTSVEAVTTDGRSISARLADDAFYLEVRDGRVSRLVAHRSDGSSDSVALVLCPPTVPDCAK